MTTSARYGRILLCPPGPLAQWASNLVTALAARAGASASNIDRHHEMGGEATRSHIYLCQYPSLSVIQAIEVGDIDPVLVVANPVDNAAYAMGQGNATLLEALRSLTASMVANLAIGRTSRARLVFPDFDQPMLATARKMSGALGLPTDLATLHAVISELFPSGLVDAPLGPTLFAANVAQPADRDRAVIGKVTGPMNDMAQGILRNPIVWSTELFLSGDRPNEPAPPVAMVTGPARVMLYGPYLHLPPSEYRVELIVAFTGHIEDIPFLLELYGGPNCLGQFRMEGRRSGGYRGQFRFRNLDPVAPVEIRLRNERGAIEGEIALVEMRLFPAAQEDSAFS